MMEKFALDEHLEQLNAQRRRMKQLEHKRAVDALVDERRKLIQLEYEQQMAERAREKMLEEYRQQVIEQERQRLLHEHASQLLGYLPKGVLRDERDLALFDEEFRRKFESFSLTA
ncbi:tumor suppressor, Mitostatin-domain-containing protein [Zopfochytrium polystomum]|nr:tumor suppressor, Mitostatin-domain-containing protein [Zopfochytrium polystomum]